VRGEAEPALDNRHVERRAGVTQFARGTRVCTATHKLVRDLAHVACAEVRLGVGKLVVLKRGTYEVMRARARMDARPQRSPDKQLTILPARLPTHFILRRGDDRKTKEEIGRAHV
jgi:hypothetical protein